MLNKDNITKILLNKNLTIATAESCSGGLLANKITDFAGSSKIFMLGVITYSNKTKISLLKIKQKTLKYHGAVSKQVAEAMATNVKKLASTDIGIGITGIAGPTGGTRHKPVGTIFISISYKNKMITKRFLFKGTRIEVKRKTTQKAIGLIKQCLKN